MVFDVPILLAEPQMLREQLNATNTGGIVSSNYIGIEPCPHKWTAESLTNWILHILELFR